MRVPLLDAGRGCALSCSTLVRAGHVRVPAATTIAWAVSSELEAVGIAGMVRVVVRTPPSLYWRDADSDDFLDRFVDTRRFKLTAQRIRRRC